MTRPRPTHESSSSSAELCAARPLPPSVLSMAGAVAPSSQHMTLSHYVPPVSAGSAAGAAASAVDCYTCRRRRVKCDRALPHCAKCERTKLDCLGYKKPLVWNKGVASRGKMMGKTFPAPAAPGPAPAVPTVRTLSSPAAHGHQNAHRPLGVSQQSQLVRPSQLAPQPPSPPAVQVRLPRPVASGNPFEHLDAESRSYMAYCASPMCPLRVFIPSYPIRPIPETSDERLADVDSSRAACRCRLCAV